MKLAVLASALLLLLSACSHSASRNETAPPASGAAAAAKRASPAPTDGWKEIEIKAPVLLRLKGDPARVELVSYCATSDSKTFAGSEVREDRSEQTEFSVETKASLAETKASLAETKASLAETKASLAETKASLADAKANPDRISQNLKTTQKNGGMDLHDFAMPEKGETLAMVLDGRGRVIRAGNFPKGSLYYVPTISLPEDPVGKGDTWTMQASWTPIGEDTVLQLDMLSILKGFWQCGPDRCAEIEISGGVQAFVGRGGAVPGYRNEWRGRMLFDVDSGLAVWSRLESDETFENESGRRIVSSSLDGALVEPAALKAPLRLPSACGAAPASPSAPRK